MKKIILLFTVLVTALSCDKTSKTEQEISKIDIPFKVERFDEAFAKATPEDLPKLKASYPFLFSKRISDSVWINRMQDTLQEQLFEEVDKVYHDFDDVELEIEKLFQHLKYYDKTFAAPRVITLTSDVDYRNKTIVTDTIALIALDTYLGADHEFYSGIQKYIVQNMTKSQIVPDLATNYAEKYSFQSQRKTLLDEMVYYGKLLYFKDRMIPFKTDAEKIGYLPEQLAWSQENESYIWRYFIDKEMLYSTDTGLAGRFIAPAPFSKFYLELDRESPGRLGQFIGWQIVRSYMEHNDVDFKEMLQMEASEIFNNSKYKPRK
ncbi:gliding motility lipoprotein GldB [Mangrovimonas sp. DI 80]|uniref:gliding motility lipoprotein GldB n=1 Tax=Mangrovimonas sp. DI 80 TaxID=1779330 RepID=UPI000977F8C2|nr:gliding motility lipoprotein GldB [Mangrovimonas sp. DI 80]OMP31564.1 gliding motility lipoprotein GldB [Mangrovimonas sp. DI 80]